jgi:hypothetical protein
LAGGIGCLNRRDTVAKLANSSRREELARFLSFFAIFLCVGFSIRRIDKVDHKLWSRTEIGLFLLHFFAQPKDYPECAWVTTRSLVGLLRKCSLEFGNRTCPVWALDDNLLFEDLSDEGSDVF